MDINLITPKFFTLNCKFIAPSLTYEHYLLDVVNGSVFFFSQKKTFMEQFHLVEKQSNGEDDVASSLYSMDFKLLVDQDVMNAMAKNKPEVDYSQQKEGYIFVREKRDKIPVPNNNILLEIMRLSDSDVESGQGLSKSVSCIRDFLRKDKNLFIYYPYEFSSETDLPYNAYERILNETLAVIMRYRDQEHLGKDTFLCIKANQWFLIFEWTPDGFVIRDRVHEVQCGNYRDIRLYSLY